jgi:hypothetical protein
MVAASGGFGSEMEGDMVPSGFEPRIGRNPEAIHGGAGKADEEIVLLSDSP